MKIKKHSNGFYYAHLTGGIEISLKTRNKQDAETAAREAKLAELEKAKRMNLLTAEVVTRLTSGGRVTGEQAIKEWTDWAETVGLSPNTVARYQSDIGIFLRETNCVNASIAKATAKQVSAFVNPTGELSASTRRNRLSAIQSFFAVCVAKGFTVLDPSALVRVNLSDLTLEQKEPAARVPFTDGELNLLRGIEDPFWQTFVLLGENFGLRISDVAQLEWASIRPGILLVWTDKRDKRLEMPMASPVEKQLRALPVTDERFVFPRQAELAKDPTRRSTLPTYFARVLGRLGIEGKSSHCLRHTFASKRAGLGDTTDEIRLKLGHSSAETTQNYIHHEKTERAAPVTTS